LSFFSLYFLAAAVFMAIGVGAAVVAYNLSLGHRTLAGAVLESRNNESSGQITALGVVVVPFQPSQKMHRV
jgi:hypothetical protein